MGRSIGNHERNVKHMDMVTHDLRNEVVRYLSKSAGGGRESTVRKEMSKCALRLNTGADCSFRMDDSFEQGVFYLPAAIDFLLKLPLEMTNFENDLFWAIGATLNLLSVHRAALDRAMLTEPTCLALTRLATAWNSQVFSIPKVVSGLSVHIVPPTGILLGVSSERHVKGHDRDALLWLDLYNDWTRQKEPVEASANLLFMFMGIRQGTSHSSLLRNHRIGSDAFNVDIYYAHWKQCQEFLAATLDASTYRAFRGAFGNSRVVE